MSLIAAHGLHKQYGQHVVLRAADVSIAPGERVGVVGLNGAGKSTLGRILAGVETADGGTVSRQRGANIVYLDQVPRFEGDPTASEAVASGLAAWKAAIERHAVASAALAEDSSGAPEHWLAEQHRAAEDVERLGGWDQQHRITAVLGHLGIKRPEARLSEMSGGEQRRVALARVLLARPDLAILDEPTNHLDAETVEWLERYLLDEFEGAVLLVTHDRYLLDNVATRTWEVADGDVYSYEGGYERYLEQKAERQAHAARTEQNRQNFLRRELEWLRRMPKARTTKQTARVERAEAALGQARPKQEQKVTLELDLTRGGKTLLETHALTVALGSEPLVAELSLYVREGDRIGIVGPNGAGKTTLLRALLGELAPRSGTVALARNTRVAYFDQGRSGLDDKKSIYENVAGDQSKIEIGGEFIEPRQYLERFAFDSHKQRQPVASLSGGERARVALARLLMQRTNLLVLDEPTNDLDVATLGSLESMLIDFGVAALIVTHDRYFLDRVATSILAFEGGGRVVRYPGSYDTFRRLRAEARELSKAREPEPAARSAPPAAPAPAGAPKRKGLSYKEQQELAALPERIEEAERAVSALVETLANPATYSGGQDVARLTSELDGARELAGKLLERWAELEERSSG